MAWADGDEGKFTAMERTHREGAAGMVSAKSMSSFGLIFERLLRTVWDLRVAARLALVRMPQRSA